MSSGMLVTGLTLMSSLSKKYINEKPPCRQEGLASTYRKINAPLFIGGICGSIWFRFAFFLVFLMQCFQGSQLGRCQNCTEL